MIETLMALWNRGMGGRLLVMLVTFFCLCISISLLFVTAGSVWGSLLAHEQPRGEATPVTNATLLTATVPPSVTTAPVQVTPTLPPNPCLASPTGTRGNTARADATGKHEKNGVPTRTATSGPLRKTPTPGATMLPGPSPTASPTLPAVTPTAPLVPTVTIQPTVTPIATNTPTVTLAPTGTSTPTVPVSTPTVVLAPTGTETPTVIVAGTVTPVTTPTVPGTAPSGSPTVTVSATSGIAGRQTHDGRPQVPGTPVDAHNGQSDQGNCLGDSLMTGGEANLLSRLQGFFWAILLTSLLGTTLFCTRMYRLSRNAH